MNNKEEVKKWCPFLKEWCTGEVIGRCAIAIELGRSAGGVRQKALMCPFPAIVIILSEINLKTQVPQQQRIVLPGSRG